MSNPLRHKGKFVKASVLNKQRNFVSKMACAKENKKLKETAANITQCERENERPNICSGRRIVELSILGEHLKCSYCKEILSLENVESEKRMGLNSILIVKCVKCYQKTMVPTGKTHGTKDSHQHADVNTKAVLGTVHAGMGCTALNKLLACLNVPTVSNDLFKRYEREVGAALEQSAKESCRRAAETEKKLVIENIDKLCDELPPDIVREIYPFRSVLNIPKSPDNSGSTSSNPHNKFDTALGSVINIIVSYDMGWSTRGTGRKYDSLNGYGTIIGFLSGKILDFATRNRKCKSCDNGVKKEDHDCRKNFEGSAKAMEADVGAYLVNESAILKEVGLRARVIVGDEDSSTIASVRRGTDLKIFKLADGNHLRKHFVNDLYELAKHYKEMREKKTIPHLKKCFVYAVRENKGKAAELAATLRIIPEHVFGHHENCGCWCSRTNPAKEKKPTILLRDPELYVALQTLFSKYSNNASKFAMAASSQANENVNGMMAHKAPKNRCYSRSESTDFRLASTVCNKNDGEIHLVDVTNKLHLSPGKHMESYCRKKDKFRWERAERVKTKPAKIRRNLLAQKREELRKKKEMKEGVKYQSNCGFTIDSDKSNLPLNEECLEELQAAQRIFSSLNDFAMVYFDLETSGLEKKCDILQIAAKSDSSSFNIYVTPTQKINRSASEVTGLTEREGELYYNNNQVISSPLNEALVAFNEFLKSFQKPCILIAHNAPFDTGHLIRAIIENSMIANFRNIFGFTDSLAIFKKLFPDRKGTGMMKLGKLAEDFLEITGNFHEALFDVEVLQTLSEKLITKEQLLLAKKSYFECVVSEITKERASTLLPSLMVLKSNVSDGMLKKIANAGISFDMLLKASKQKEGIMQLLSERNDMNKPRVTKTKKVIDKIISFFQSSQSNET